MNAARIALTKNSVGLSTDTPRTLGSASHGIAPLSSRRPLPGARLVVSDPVDAAGAVFSLLTISRPLPAGEAVTLGSVPTVAAGVTVNHTTFSLYWSA